MLAGILIVTMPGKKGAAAADEDLSTASYGMET